MEPKSTTHTTPHKHQPIATGASHKFVVNRCELVDIKAFCTHTGGKAGAEGKEEPPAPPKPGPPAPPAKPGTPPPKPGEPPPPGGGQRLAKEDESPLPASGRPAPPTGRPPQPPVPGHPPAPGHPAVPKPKPLLLQVVPTAPEGPERSAESHGVKATPASPSHSAGGDTVTLVATMDGECSQYPQWTITDLSHLSSSRLNSKPATHIGKKWSYAFLPPAPLIGVKRFLGTAWLEDVQPRKYKVTCIAKQHQPTAHHELHVWVYPPGKASLEISSEAGPKPPWEANLDKVRAAIEGLFEHAAELVPALSDTKVELFTGKVTIKNGWEEVEGSNLVHFKVDADADIELIKISTTLPVPVLTFFQKAKKLAKVIDEGEKIEHFFEEKFHAYVEAGLFLRLAISVGVKGAASWDKEEDNHFTAHLEGMSVEAVASIGLEAALDVGYIKSGKKGQLAELSGKASSDMTLSTSPRLEVGPHLWLDNSFSWTPLELEITAKLNSKRREDLPPPSSKPITPAKVKASTDKPKDDSLLSLSWKGEVFEKITDRALLSVDLLSGATEAHPVDKKQPSLHAPPPKPAVKPPVQPAVPAR